MSSNPPADDAAATAATAATAVDGPSDSTWAQAQANRDWLLRSTAMDQLEHDIAALQQALQASENQVQVQESQIASLRQSNDELQEKFHSQSVEFNQLKTQMETQNAKTIALQETHQMDTERSDRLQAEADSLREEIRYVTKVNVGQPCYWIV